MKECQSCKATSPIYATSCSACGASLITTTGKPYEWLGPAGLILIVLGPLVGAYGFFASGAAQYSDTLNIGLLNDKSNLVGAGGFMFLSGSIFLAASAIVDRLDELLKK